MAHAGRFHDFYYLLLHTGIRPTDAFKLKPEHFEGRYLKVQMNKTGDFLHVPIPEHVLMYYSLEWGCAPCLHPLNQTGRDVTV